MAYKKVITLVLTYLIISMEDIFLKISESSINIFGNFKSAITIKLSKIRSRI